MNVIRRLLWALSAITLWLAPVSGSVHAALVATPGWQAGGVCSDSSGTVSDCLAGFSLGSSVLSSYQSIGEPTTEAGLEAAISFSFLVPLMTGGGIPDTLAGATNVLNQNGWDSTATPMSDAAHTRVVILTDNEGPAGTAASVSDVIIRYAKVDSVAGTAKLMVGMWSDPGPVAGSTSGVFNQVANAYAQNPTNLGLPNLGSLTVLPETGTLQDLTPYLFPNANGALQVLVQSDVEPVPEPQQWMLLLAGLVLGAWTFRHRLNN